MLSRVRIKVSPDLTRVHAPTFVHLSVDGFTSPEVELGVHEPQARVARHRRGTSKIRSSVQNFPA